SGVEKAKLFRPDALGRHARYVPCRSPSLQFGPGGSAGLPLQRPVLPASRVVSSAADSGDRATLLPHLADGTSHPSRDLTRIAMDGRYSRSSPTFPTRKSHRTSGVHTASVPLISPLG